MKKTLLSIIVLGSAVFSLSAQTYSPTAVDGLATGSLSASYADDIEIANGAATATVGLTDLGLPGAITALLPAGSPTSFTFDVTSVSYTAEGLPSGLSSSSANVLAGGAGTVSLTGTPTEAGLFVVNLTSETSGAADISALLDALDGIPGAALALAAAGVTNPFTVPQPVPGLFDEEGYELFVNDPNGIEEANETFSLGVYPNPTDGISTLDVNSTVAGNATIEVYSITGSMVQTSVKTIRIGANRLNLDLTAVPAGIYLVKADISGSQALVRMQKK
ncbi:MAG: T9SS type A sorting domain-containing protein [Flavobacteriales bacterium]